MPKKATFLLQQKAAAEQRYAPPLPPERRAPKSVRKGSKDLITGRDPLKRKDLEPSRALGFLDPKFNKENQGDDNHVYHL